MRRGLLKSAKAYARSSRILAPAVGAYDALGLIAANWSTPGHLKTTIKAHVHQDSYIFGHWWPSLNFGDAISPLIISALSHKTALCASIYPKPPAMECFSVVGSVLSFHGPKLTIWGSGYISENSRLFRDPRRICAVRGPRTRERLLRQGYECPSIYGDPAVLLFDRLADLPRSRDFKVGLISHYLDSNHPVVRRFARDDRVLSIDVFWPAEAIARAVARCETIVSSSLHGLILADCMGVPNRWLGVSQAVQKGGFKFYDYFDSVRREESPLGVDDLAVDRVVAQAHCRHVPFSREALIEACPFRSPSITSMGATASAIVSSLRLNGASNGEPAHAG